MSRKLFVGNLPYSVTSERLSEAFSQFGTVTSSKVIVDRETGRSRGFGFVTMGSPAEGQAAIQALNGQDCEGRPLRVRAALFETAFGDQPNGLTTARITMNTIATAGTSLAMR